MTRIKLGDKDKIFQYVSGATLFYNPGTTTLSGDNIFKFERSVYILGNIIDIEGFPDNNNEKRGLISRGIGRFSRYKRKSASSFTKALEAEMKQVERQNPNKFFVIFPLNISYKTLNGRKQFTLMGTKLKTRSFKQVYDNFDFKRPFYLLRSSRRSIEGSIYDFTYIILEAFARTEMGAFEIARQQVQLFRSLCNFVLSYGMITWQTGYPSPLGRINLSKYMFIFNSERRFLDYWFSVGEFRYRLLELNPNELQAISKDMKAFEGLKTNKLKEILINCLTLYGYALDEIEPGYIFLNLWQILELIALKEPSGISLGKVKNRIKAIFRDNPTISDALEALFCKRNHLVHEGQLRNFSLQDVNQIKGITEGCIDFLFTHVNKLKNKEGLHDFYENIRQTEERLGKKMAVLRYVKKVPK
jgi:hypothetical protein